jgi:putative transposase
MLVFKITVRFFIFLIKFLQIIRKSKNDLIIENLALRQQLAIYQTKKTKPKLTNIDRSFWIALKRSWCKWADYLIIVKPETVIAWQKRRFKKHWTKISTQNKKPGRKRIKKEIRDLIYRMAGENRWGAPRIYSELLMLGFSDVSEASVSRYLRKYRSLHLDKKKQQSWMTFLKNHRDVISAMDFFIVPAVNFNILFVFFIIDHKRRKIIHLNITNQPCALWVIQQLRNAFPFDQIPKYLIMDRDSIFSARVKGFLKRQLGIKPKVTSYKSPWQNGVAERLVKSIRNELLNNVVVFSEDHLRRLMRVYVDYYNKDRCHLSLNRDSPMSWKVDSKHSKNAKVKSEPILGGLHHKYIWRKAA